LEFVPGFDGILGWIAARAMERMNADAEREAVRRLHPLAGEHVLAIGFGPGVGLQNLLETEVAQVLGVDPSAVMNSVAAVRNSQAIGEGRLKLVKAEIADFDDSLRPFDGAIAVHTLQMCQPFEPTATKLAALLRTGGRLVSITHAWAAAKDCGSEDRFVEVVEQGLIKAGFQNVMYATADAEKGTAILIEATR
jgi:SAM-dependent methyltransferase